MVTAVLFNLARPPGDSRNAAAALAVGAFGAAEWRIAGIRIDVLPGAVIGGPYHKGVFIDPQLAQLIHDMANAGIHFHHRVGVFALRHRLADVIRIRHVRLVVLHKVDAHEERFGRFCVCFEIVQRGLLDVAVEEWDPDHALFAINDRGIHILAVNFELFLRRFARLAGERAAGDTGKHFTQLRIHIREPGRVGIGIGVQVVEADVFHFVVALSIR